MVATVRIVCGLRDAGKTTYIKSRWPEVHHIDIAFWWPLVPSYLDGVLAAEWTKGQVDKELSLWTDHLKENPVDLVVEVCGVTGPGWNHVLRMWQKVETLGYAVEVYVVEPTDWAQFEKVVSSLPGDGMYQDYRRGGSKWVRPELMDDRVILVKVDYETGGYTYPEQWKLFEIEHADDIQAEKDHRENEDRRRAAQEGVLW